MCTERHEVVDITDLLTSNVAALAWCVGKIGDVPPWVSNALHDAQKPLQQLEFRSRVRASIARKEAKAQ